MGGWLFWLILGLIALCPALDMAKLQASFHFAEAYLPVLGNEQVWLHYKIVAWTCFFVSAIAGMYAGDRLLFMRSWRAVQQALAAIWLKFCIGTLILDYVLPGALVLDTWPDLNPSGIMPPIFLYASATGYLLKSKRVRHTYPRDEG